MSIKYKLKGHETFVIREGWLNKGLVAVHDNKKVFSEHSGADALGVGTNMAKAIRYWMNAAGLINKTKDGIVLSELGKVIYDNDIYFEDIFTLWIMHMNIVLNSEIATSWNVFFNSDYMKEFDKMSLYTQMQIELEKYVDQELSKRSVTDDCNVLLNMYAAKSNSQNDPEDKNISPFNSLQLLVNEGDRYKKVAPKMTKLHQYIVWYGIKNMLTTDSGISIQKLVEGENSVGRILNLGRMDLNYYLDILEDERILTVNRTAGLDMVYIKDNISTIDIIKRYYGTI